jgi:hypothetical protein
MLGARGDQEVAITCAALPYRETGKSVATRFVDATIRFDPDNETLSGS